MNQMPPPPSSGNSKRVSAGILGILLGALGIHKFVLGYSKAGVIMLLVSIIGAVFFFLGPIIMGTIGLIEGIIYLTKSDAEFHNTYVANKKEWF
jgi:TM2 domain-containing membrane protein YozV